MANNEVSSCTPRSSLLLFAAMACVRTAPTTSSHRDRADTDQVPAPQMGLNDSGLDTALPAALDKIVKTALEEAVARELRSRSDATATSPT